MTETIVFAALAGFGAALVVVMAAVLVRAGGDLGRLGSAWSALPGGPDAPRAAPTTARPEPDRPAGAPLRLLALLQREGRLVDFLLEDISAAADAQVGASVREIHQKCAQVLRDHLDFEPVLAGAEGASVTVPAGFDPAAVRLTGNVTGQPPFTGTLLHHGWRVGKFRLPDPPAGRDERVIAPAEVEV